MLCTYNKILVVGSLLGPMKFVPIILDLIMGIGINFIL